MKSIPKFKLGFLYHGKHLVPPFHGNLLVLVASLHGSPPLKLM
jgi:hypothetical protein